MTADHRQYTPDSVFTHPDAACAGLWATNSELHAAFIPTFGQGSGRDVIERATAPAKAICAGCPVRDACLTWALDHPAAAGHAVYGGHDHAQRARILKQRRKKAA